MTFLGYTVKDKRIIIAMDTMASTRGNYGKISPIAFLEKCVWLPNLNVYIAGTGSLDIIAEIVHFISEDTSGSIDEAIDKIEFYLPRISRRLQIRSIPIFSEKCTIRIFRFSNNLPEVISFQKSEGSFDFIKKSNLIIEDQLKSQGGMSEEAGDLLYEAAKIFPKTYDLLVEAGRKKEESENCIDKIKWDLATDAIFGQLQDLQNPTIGIGGEFYIYSFDKKERHPEELLFEFADNAPTKEKTNMSDIRTITLDPNKIFK